MVLYKMKPSFLLCTKITKSLFNEIRMAFFEGTPTVAAR